MAEKYVEYRMVKYFGEYSRNIFRKLFITFIYLIAIVPANKIPGSLKN